VLLARVYLLRAPAQDLCWGIPFVNRSEYKTPSCGLTDLFDNSIGKPALANVSISFESVDGHDMCRVEVQPSLQPVYARGKQSMDFYVRLNNGTGALNIEEAVEYVAAHEWSR